jgi:hypothetical protein
MHKAADKVLRSRPPQDRTAVRDDPALAQP